MTNPARGALTLLTSPFLIPRPFRPLAVALVVSALSGPGARAQIIVGHLLTDATPQRPIGGALVSLVDSAGTGIAAIRSDPGGVFVLRLPAAGTYRLQARRAGFQIVTSPPVAVAVGERKTLNFVVASYPLEPSPLARARRPEIEHRLRLAGAGVYEITRAQLARYEDGFHDAASAIRMQQVPGLTIRDAARGLCVLRQRTTRGRPAPRCMIVMLDGSIGADLRAVDPGELALIAIVDGPAATDIWGPDAEPGVVLLLTRRAS